MKKKLINHSLVNIKWTYGLLQHKNEMQAVVEAEKN